MRLTQNRGKSNYIFSDLNWWIRYCIVLNFFCSLLLPNFHLQFFTHIFVPNIFFPTFSFGLSSSCFSPRFAVRHHSYHRCRFPPRQMSRLFLFFEIWLLSQYFHLQFLRRLHCLSVVHILIFLLMILFCPRYLPFHNGQFYVLISAK